MFIRQQEARASCLAILTTGLFLALAACGGDDGPGPTAEAPGPGTEEPAPPQNDDQNQDPGSGQDDGLADSGGGSTDDGSPTQDPAPEEPASGNSAPTIGGAPKSTALAGSPYVFEPDAVDPDGDSLSFQISQKPAWAQFAPGTGRLEGTPGPGDVGSYSGIVISVSDGQAEASLGAFDITVEAVANGAVTLDWVPPQLNTDGTPLTDLAGFTLYWGTEPGSYSESVTIENPGVTTYVLENLVPGTYYFAATAFNEAGLESDLSNEAAETVL